MLKIIAPVFVVGALVGFVRAEARACSCTPLSGPTESLAAASAVFEGKVVSDLARGSVLFPRTLNFRVVRAWKGAVADAAVSVLTGANSAGCGYDQKLTPGTAMLVYADSVDGNLLTGICTRTRAIAEADEDLAALGPPVSASSLPIGDSDTQRAPYAGGCTLSGSGGSSGWLLAPGALLAAGLFAKARRRRRGSVTHPI